MVHQLAQSQVVDQGYQQDQSGIGHQAVIVEGNLDAVGALQWCIRWLFLVSGWFSLSKTMIPEAGNTFSSHHHDATLFLSVDWG